MSHYLIPEWPAPDSVKAISTLRTGGVSQAPFASQNLGLHVGDAAESVQQNRNNLPCPEQPLWLNQVHGTDIIELNHQLIVNNTADGSYTRAKQRVCVVMTADCLPVLLTDTAGSFVAALHCGWRGLAGGILEKLIQTITPEGEVLAWLGPAIGPQAFEVGGEVREAFASQQNAFKPLSGNKYLADIFAIATMKLNACGVNQVYTSGLCTYSDEARFFSYRRDGQTGRMATLIWLQ